MSRPEGGLILIMLFRMLKNVIACLIIRLRSRVCKLKGHCIEFGVKQESLCLLLQETSI